MTNTLYYGDNLDILRRYIADESVDLIYLDPPFNSNQVYNVLFEEINGSRAAAQIKAFKDTWQWDQSAAAAFQEVVENGGNVSFVLQAFRTFLGQSNLMAYLAMMAPRVVELRRVLKPSGSLYLHCDPTASHYLKLLMDAVFGPTNFRSEIIWRRSTGHNKLNKQYGPIHDTILFYSKQDAFFFEPGTRPVARGYIREWFTGEDEGGPFRTNMLTGPGRRSGSSGQPWRGFDPTSVGRHWAIPATLRTGLPPEAANWDTQQTLDYLFDRGHIYIPRDGLGQPKYRQYVSSAIPYQDIWAYQPYTQGCLYGTDECIDEDVKWLQHERERLPYPTQKPEGLLDRIITSSSRPGDVVLDPFCGCGTATVASQRLGRQWIGIDITHLAISLIKARLSDSFGSLVYKVIGEPVSIEDAASLAATDQYQFQWWALGLVGARPAEQKKGADRGIDGHIFFHDDANGKTKHIILSVKAGKTGPAHVRDLVGVLDREKAVIGVLISMQDPTREMRKEAASAGYYTSPWGTKHPRVQLLTIAELLSGKTVDYPPTQANVTLKKAPKALKPKGKQSKLFGA